MVPANKLRFLFLIFLLLGMNWAANYGIGNTFIVTTAIPYSNDSIYAITGAGIAAGGFSNDSLYRTITGVFLYHNANISSDLSFANATAGHWFYANATAFETGNGNYIKSVSINSSYGSCVQYSNSTTGRYFSVAFNCSAAAPGSSTLNITFDDESGKNTTTSTLSNSYPDPNLPILSPAPFITPFSPNDANTLTCNSGTFFDADGDIQNLSAQNWSWFKNGNIISGQNSVTLSPAFFAAGDTVLCQEFSTNSTWTTSNVTANSTGVLISSSFSYTNTSPVQTLAILNSLPKWKFQVNVTVGSGTCLVNISQLAVQNLTTINDSSGNPVANNGNQTSLNFSCSTVGAPYNVTFYTENLSSVTIPIYSQLGANAVRWNVTTSKNQPILYNFSAPLSLCTSSAIFICTQSSLSACDVNVKSLWQLLGFTDMGWLVNTTTSNETTYVTTCAQSSSGSSGGGSSGNPSLPIPIEGTGTNVTLPKKTATPPTLLSQVVAEAQDWISELLDTTGRLIDSWLKKKSGPVSNALAVFVIFVIFLTLTFDQLKKRGGWPLVILAASIIFGLVFIVVSYGAYLFD